MVLAVIGVCSSEPAKARDPPGAPREACAEDYKRLCAGVARGGGRIRKCMTDNAEKLSPACRAALASRIKSN
jgi:hypothetical protein